MPHCPATVGVLLAAGLGTRFAAADPAGGSKLLAPLPDGRPVALAAAQQLLAATSRVLAVVRPGNEALAALLRQAGCEVLQAEAAERGMGASLAAAATHLLQERPPLDVPAAILVALADMPWIRQDTLARLVVLSRRYAVTAPVHLSRRGHPVGFSAALLPELALLDGDTGARSVVAKHPVHAMACDDPGVLRDVDTPADLAR
jgi:molybdenum cofactor cytidylyltransferase